MVKQWGDTEVKIESSSEGRKVAWSLKKERKGGKGI